MATTDARIGEPDCEGGGKAELVPKMMCLIVLSCAEISGTSKKELEETIIELKKLKDWEIERITLMEDQRNVV